jgi:NADPH-dependent 2,4-dienoyl-CoA reductase/sulfur reductase-like enzyme
MCRALIADPYWPKKVKEGRLNEIHQCLRCTNCLGEMHPKDQFRCDVNPFTGHEVLFHDIKPTAEQSKNVWVVGGGPGGMTAAVTACVRGHKVTLFEASDRLGGALNYTDHDQKFKRDLHLYKEKLVARVGELPIEVKLNTKVTPELVQEGKPDALFIAIGADPIYPPIPGLTKEKVTTGYACYQAPEKVGHKVVVIGGGLVGAETAIYLADLGHEVTVVEMNDTMAAEANMHHGTAVREKLDELGVTCLVNTKCVQVGDGAIEVEDKEGNRSTLSGDTIVLSAGYRARTAEVDTLLGLTEEFAIIGDCKKATRVRGAVFDGTFAAINLG